MRNTRNDDVVYRYLRLNRAPSCVNRKIENKGPVVFSETPVSILLGLLARFHLEKSDQLEFIRHRKMSPGYHLFGPPIGIMVVSLYTLSSNTCHVDSSFKKPPGAARRDSLV